MRKNLRVIQINGFRGLLMALFVVICLVAGFIAFPAFMSMNIWNYFAFKITSMPPINFLEGLLLWGIISFSVFIFNKRKLIVSVNSQQELTEEEIKKVVANIKSQTELKENEFNK